MTKTKRCIESKENSYKPRLALNNGVNGVNNMAGKAVTVAVRAHREDGEIEYYGGSAPLASR